MGIGLAYNTKQNLALSFEVRNNLGLSNISAVEIVNNGTLETNTINFLFGLTYKIGQRN